MILQIIPITISNSTKYIKQMHCLHDVIKKWQSKERGLNGDCKTFQITNAISKSSKLQSKQVSSKVSSESPPN